MNDTETRFNITRSLVENILRNAHNYRWTLQGFGMLRTYLPGDVRLAVWHSDFRVPNVSLIHDHPWDFNSQVIAGELHNQRYVETNDGRRMMCRTIKPGVGLKMIAEDTPAMLSKKSTELYLAGETYYQKHNEIHESLPEDGTVTIVSRKRAGEDIARVFYPRGEEWVSGEPHDANLGTITAMTRYALDRWFS